MSTGRWPINGRGRGIGRSRISERRARWATGTVATPSAPCRTTGGHSEMTRLAHAILIAAVCLIAYSNTFHVPFQFDDKYQIAAKPFVRDVRAFIDPSKVNLYAADHAFRVRTVGYLTF